MTRLGDLLDFGPLFKALGNNSFAKSPTFLGNFCKGVRIYHFSSEIIFGQPLKTFGNLFGHTGYDHLLWPISAARLSEFFGG